MKKLRKFFNVLPVGAIAFVSGIAGLLFKDQAINSVDAASSQTLFTNQYQTSYQLTYSNHVTNYNVQRNSFFYTHTVSTSGSDYSTSFAFQLKGVTMATNGAVDWTLGFSGALDTLQVVRNGLPSTLTYFEYRIQTLTVQPSFADYTLQRIPASLFFEYRFSTDDTYSVQGQYNCYISPDTPMINTRFTDFVSCFSSSSYSSPVTLFTFTYTPSSAQQAYDAGYEDGYKGGYSDGYSKGNGDGYKSGYDNGFSEGADSRDVDVTNAYNEGYSAGYNDGYNVDGTVASIFSGVLQVGMLPVNVFLAIFNFEILGINLSAFIGALLTVCLTVIVIRTIKGGGSSD